MVYNTGASQRTQAHSMLSRSTSKGRRYW